MTPEFIHESFELVGSQLRWRVRPESHFSDYRSYRSWNAKNAGRVAGSRKRRGRMVKLSGQMIPAQVIVAFMVTGQWYERVYHDDGDVENNHPGNLLTSTRDEIPRAPVDGCGVRQRESGRWLAQIRSHEGYTYLGTYATREEAEQARQSAIGDKLRPLECI